jgi:DNA-directed RNA polymerase specialized sigma24 family protein
VRRIPTAHQMQFIDMLVDGYTQKEMAALTRLDRRNVQRALERARRRLGARTNEELVAQCFRHRYVA